MPPEKRKTTPLNPAINKRDGINKRQPEIKKRTRAKTPNNNKAVIRNNPAGNPTKNIIQQQAITKKKNELEI